MTYISNSEKHNFKEMGLSMHSYYMVLEQVRSSIKSAHLRDTPVADFCIFTIKGETLPVGGFIKNVLYDGNYINIYLDNEWLYLAAEQAGSIDLQCPMEYKKDPLDRTNLAFILKYTYHRVNRLYEIHYKEKGNIRNLKGEKELFLLKQLALLPREAEKIDAQPILKQGVKIVNAFENFYYDKAPLTDDRLELFKATKTALLNCVEILGLDTIWKEELM